MVTLRDAWAWFARRTPEDNRQVLIGGEVGFADPMRLFSGRVFAPFNPSVLVSRKGLAVYEEMRRDEQVKAAMKLKKETVVASGWEIVTPAEISEGEEWEPRQFVEWNFGYLAGTFERSLKQILTGLDFGYSVTEKVFADPTPTPFGEKVKLDALKTLHPKGIDFRVDEHGNLVEIVQQQIGGMAPLPIEKMVVFTHEREFGNYYGKSDLEAAYRAWWTKDNTYKWLGMLLERLGIPPIFALYDPDRYTGAQVDVLKDVFKNLQAATNALIPRPTAKGASAGKADPAIDFWAPELAKQATDVFIPALDRFDKDIARSILMPGLLGMTPDSQQGSFARSKVSFDVFMLVVEAIRREIAEEVVQEQIVEQLVDLNYDTGGVYPEFKFLSLADDNLGAIFEAWEKMAAGGIVTATDEDERHIRQSLSFPEDFPSREDEPDDDDLPEEEMPVEPEDNDESLLEPAAFALSRQPNRFEKKVDFKAIDRGLEEIEADALKSIGGAIVDVRDGLVKKLFPKRGKGFDVTNPQAATKIVNNLRLTGFAPVRVQIGAFLRETLDFGGKTVRRELGASAFKVEDGPNFTPVAAARSLDSKKLEIAGVIEGQTTAEAKRILSRAIETGELQRETEAKIKALFEPYVGNPSIVTDAGVVEPSRLATIVRTNSTEAFNRGRLVQGRAAGDLVHGWEYSAVIDGRTTAVCQFLDGRIFLANDPNLDALAPPRHFNCRSILVPVTIDIPIPEDKVADAADAGRGLDLSGKGFT